MTESERNLLIWCAVLLQREKPQTAEEAAEIDRLIAAVRRADGRGMSGLFSMMADMARDSETEDRAGRDRIAEAREEIRRGARTARSRFKIRTPI